MARKKDITTILLTALFAALVGGVEIVFKYFLNLFKNKEKLSNEDIVKLALPGRLWIEDEK